MLHSNWMCEDEDTERRDKDQCARKLRDAVGCVTTFMQEGGEIRDLQGLPLDPELLKYLSLIPYSIGAYLAWISRESRPVNASKEIKSLIMGNFKPEHVQQVIDVACATFNRRLDEVAKTFPAEVTTVLFQK